MAAKMPARSREVERASCVVAGRACSEREKWRADCGRTENIEPIQVFFSSALFTTVESTQQTGSAKMMCIFGKLEKFANLMPYRIFVSLLALIVALLVGGRAMANAGATYYIDWSEGNDANDGQSTSTPWQRVPGMPGFAANYLHQAGDRFVFKGGVVWPSSALPLTISGSGTAETPDAYTTDRSWYAGREWAQPVFDSEGTGTQLLKGIGKRHLIINDLALKNMHAPGTPIRSYGIHLENCQEIALTNNRIQPYCWRAILVIGYDGTTQHNIAIQNNDISDSAVPITIATAGPGTVIDQVEISGNRIHDLSSMIVYSVHGDGVQIFTSFDPDDLTQSIHGRVHGNTFSGSVARSSPVGTASMTAWIYLASNNGDFLVYNNVLSYSDTPLTENLFKALINVKQNTRGSSAIYNNTLRGTDPGMSAAIVVEQSQNVIVQNNILQGMRNCYDWDEVTNFSADYNVIDTTYGADWMGRLNGGFVSLRQWKGLGFDTHSIVANPRLVLPLEELRLQSGSPAIGKGIDLSDIFTTDRHGSARTEPWDIGAQVAPPSVGGLVASPDHAGSGEDITVLWALPAEGDAFDWIGLYDTTDRSRPLVWNYTGGAASGSMTFIAPSASGTYDFTYFPRGSFFGSKTSNAVTIASQRIPDGAYHLTATAGTTSGRRTIIVNWTAPADSHGSDWIGLYSTSDRDTLLAWKYTNGAASGTMTFPAPSAAGTYDFTYFLHGSYTGMATSDQITRTP